MNTSVRWGVKHAKNHLLWKWLSGKIHDKGTTRQNAAQDEKSIGVLWISLILRGPVSFAILNETMPSAVPNISLKAGIVEMKGSNFDVQQYYGPGSPCLKSEKPPRTD